MVQGGTSSPTEEGFVMAAHDHRILVRKRDKWRGWTFNWSNPYTWVLILALVAVCVVVGYINR